MVQTISQNNVATEYEPTVEVCVDVQECDARMLNSITEALVNNCITN
jgi:hypothetical protein